MIISSPGGSALLPRPVNPLTLEEKLLTVKTLASKGATIQELNIVRKNLSSVKGGRLADMTKPAKVCFQFSFISMCHSYYKKCIFLDSLLFIKSNFLYFVKHNFVVSFFFAKKALCTNTFCSQLAKCSSNSGSRDLKDGLQVYFAFHLHLYMCVY